MTRTTGKKPCSRRCASSMKRSRAIQTSRWPIAGEPSPTTTFTGMASIGRRPGSIWPKPQPKKRSPWSRTWAKRIWPRRWFTTMAKAIELDPLNPRNVNGLSVVYDLLRRYDDEAALFDRAAAANPSTRNYAQLLHAQIELEKGDLKAARSFLNLLPADYDPNGATTWTRISLSLYERDCDAAARVLASWKKEELVGGAGKVVPVSYWQGMIARTSGDRTKAAEAFTGARTAIEAQLAKQPDDPMLLATLGLLDAGLARKDERLT